MTAHGDIIREALNTLYAYTSDAANPPGEGRSWSHERGRAAVAALEAELAEARSAFRVGHETLMRMQERAEAAERQVIEYAGTPLEDAFARAEAAEEALTELLAVPGAGPFPNKGACAAFATYVQETARRGLASVAADGKPA